MAGGLALGEPPARFPDPGDGVSGIVVLPADPDREAGGFLDPEGLEVHLSPDDDPSVELGYPAGAWFQPPPGHYRIWLQGGWRMTPFAGLISYSGAGSMRAMAAIGEAGRVRLPEDLAADPDLELHLLHAGSYLEAGFLRWELSIRRPVSEVGDGVLLPVGKAVGALWDPERKRYVALSRPFLVRGHGTVEVPLAQPGGGAFLVAELQRDTPAETASDLGARMAVRQGDGERPADLQVQTTDKVFAFWYGLTPGPADLRGETVQDVLLSTKLDLRAGRITDIHADLRHRPDLDVQLSLPAFLWDGGLALEVRELPAGEVLEHRALERTVGRVYRFERTHPTRLEVELQTALGPYSSEVDLSSGEDGFLLLKLQVIKLKGIAELFASGPGPAHSGYFDGFRRRSREEPAAR
ncbi:MAG: hypothetical protein ABUT39_27790 [Acidobacteriota bacterium]